MRKVFLVLFCLSFVSSMAWANQSKRKLKIGDLGFSFQKILAGSFTMGSPLNEKGRDKDEAQVEVTITKDFEIQMTEVTQMQYFLVTGKRPSYFSRSQDCEKNWDSVKMICPDHPVEYVSWNDAKKFIKLLNASAGVEGCNGTPKDPRGCYRLPTEAEYEWAVRARTKTAYFLRDWRQLGKYAVYKNNSGGRTHKVTTGLKNPNNLNGITGNVWEWTEDHYKVELEGGKDPLNRKSGNCQSNEAECRVIRGGSWKSVAVNLRSANRDRGGPEDKGHSLGFRLVRTQKALMLATATSEEQRFLVPPREDAVPLPLSLFTPLPFL